MARSASRLFCRTSLRRRTALLPRGPATLASRPDVGQQKKCYHREWLSSSTHRSLISSSLCCWRAAAEDQSLPPSLRSGWAAAADAAEAAQRADEAWWQRRRRRGAVRVRWAAPQGLLHVAEPVVQACNQSTNRSHSNDCVMKTMSSRLMSVD